MGRELELCKEPAVAQRKKLLVMQFLPMYTHTASCLHADEILFRLLWTCMPSLTWKRRLCLYLKDVLAIQYLKKCRPFNSVPKSKFSRSNLAVQVQICGLWCTYNTYAQIHASTSENFQGGWKLGTLLHSLLSFPFLVTACQIVNQDFSSPLLLFPCHNRHLKSSLHHKQYCNTLHYMFMLS